MSVERNPNWRYAYQHIGITLMRLTTLISAGVIVAILLYLLDNALPALSWEFVFEPPRDMMTAGGVWPCIVGTFLACCGRNGDCFAPRGLHGRVFDRVWRIGSFC